MTAWTQADEDAFRYAVTAATEGLGDPGLGRLRLSGAALPTLAEAAVSSALPFLRSPLLGRISAALALHQPTPGPDGPPVCITCHGPAPCATATALLH